VKVKYDFLLVTRLCITYSDKILIMLIKTIGYVHGN